MNTSSQSIYAIASTTCGLIICFTGVQAFAAGLDVVERDDRLIIQRSGKPLAQYVFKDEKILRPYFAHVHTLDSIQVTRSHPPIAGQDPVDHDTMHPGIWLAFGDVSGHDFWRNKAAVRHERFAKPLAVSNGHFAFVTENTMIGTNGAVLAKLISHVTLETLVHGYLLVWDAEFTPVTDGFYFGDQEEMGFGVRVATPLSERNGGTITSSVGSRSASATWGNTFDWCDYSGVISNRLVGMTIMPDPKNFRPSWFHNRDYGLMVANPFGQKYFAKGGKSRVPVRRNESFHLRWAVFVHSSQTNEPPDLTAAFGQFLAR